MLYKTVCIVLLGKPVPTIIQNTKTTCEKFGLEVFRQNLLIQIHGAGPAVEDVVTVQGSQLVAHVGAIDEVRLGAPGEEGGLLSSIRETAPLRVLFIPTLVPADR